MKGRRGTGRAAKGGTRRTRRAARPGRDYYRFLLLFLFLTLSPFSPAPAAPTPGPEASDRTRGGAPEALDGDQGVEAAGAEPLEVGGDELEPEVAEGRGHRAADLGGEQPGQVV